MHFFLIARTCISIFDTWHAAFTPPTTYRFPSDHRCQTGLGLTSTALRNHVGPEVLQCFGCCTSHALLFAAAHHMHCFCCCTCTSSALLLHTVVFVLQCMQCCCTVVSEAACMCFANSQQSLLGQTTAAPAHVCCSAVVRVPLLQCCGCHTLTLGGPYMPW